MLIFADPTLSDLVNWRRIEVMQLVPASPEGDNQIGCFQYCQMLGDCLTGHIELLAELTQGLAVLRSETVEQLSASWVSQCLEHLVHFTEQLCNCLVACQAARPK